MQGVMEIKIRKQRENGGGNGSESFWGRSKAREARNCVKHVERLKSVKCGGEVQAAVSNKRGRQ